MDPLSQVLKLLSLRGCVYFNADFRAPWGMSISKNDAAQFHLVVQGTCRVLQAGVENVISTGDVVVFPHGDSHQLYDGEPKHFVDGQEVLQAVTSGRKIFQQGPRVTTRILCGHFEIDRTILHPLFANLPGTMIVRGFDQESPGWSTQLAELLLREQERGLAGSAEISFV